MWLFTVKQITKNMTVQILWYWKSTHVYLWKKARLLASKLVNLVMNKIFAIFEKLDTVNYITEIVTMQIDSAVLKSDLRLQATY